MLQQLLPRTTDDGDEDDNHVFVLRGLLSSGKLTLCFTRTMNTGM